MFGMTTEAVAVKHLPYKVVDLDGELLGEFPTSKYAREFARGMIEGEKAKELVIEWQNGPRHGKFNMDRKMISAAERKRLEAQRRKELQARRWANLISGIAVVTIGMLALLNAASAYVDARQGALIHRVAQLRPGS